MADRQWISTGHVVESPGEVDRIPDYDPRTGAHLWVVAPMFRINAELLDDMTNVPHLDQENLIYISPVFCYWCEQPFARRLLTRRCAPIGMKGKT